MTAPTPEPIDELMELVFGYLRSQGVATVARLGIPDLLQEGPLPSDELARRCGADPAYLYRMMRALGRSGVFQESPGQVFSLTPCGELLTTDHPRSMRWMAVSMCDHAHWQPWGKAFEAVREGACQTARVLGSSPWEYLSGAPEEAGRFGQAMSNLSRQAVEGINATFDFSPYRHIVDIGGNHGTLLVAMLAQSPEATGVLFDLPDVVEVARAELAGHPAVTRIRFEPGSFFDAVPEGGDLYTMKHILHDWPDAEALRILERCHRAMTPDAKLLVFDSVITPEAPPFVAWLDVHMMVLQDGKERTPEEFHRLLGDAGFAIDRILPAGRVGIVEAHPV